MTWAFLAVVVGLALLVWSAERFIGGAAFIAHHMKTPPLLIGMVIVGFGTSAPEMLVSGIAAYQGNPGIALGNAFGSNITNIALILGITALVSPITVNSNVLRKELPLLALITAFAIWLIRDGAVSREEALLLLGVFAVLMAWSIWQGILRKDDALGNEIEHELEIHEMSLRQGVFWLLAGLVVLIASSRMLVWGAVEIARDFGVSDLLIGLTVLALGTSLPELASSIAATRKGEDDIALGNVIGSNLFNTLAVVGIAGSIHPMSVGHEFISRDIPIMAGLTLSLFVIGFRFRRVGRINRIEGVLLVACYLAYMSYLANTVFAQ